jgi:hypothetical protein
MHRIHLSNWTSSCRMRTHFSRSLLVGVSDTFLSETSRRPGFSSGWVHELASRYEYQNDEGVARAGARAAQQGFYSRADFLTVVRWKSARSVPLAQQNLEEDIAQATCAALDPVDEPSRMTWRRASKASRCRSDRRCCISLSRIAIPSWTTARWRHWGTPSAARTTASASGWVTLIAARIWLAERACRSASSTRRSGRTPASQIRNRRNPSSPRPAVPRS